MLCGGVRHDLQHVLRSLHMGVLAVEDRLRGIDEPLLRASYSPTAIRGDHYTKCVKTWSAIALLALVTLGVPKTRAAKEVADVLNNHQFLPAKRSGKSITPRSVVNWVARYVAGDLKFVNNPEWEFQEALVLSDQGRRAGIGYPKAR
jgi:hypothetical protein